MPPSIVANVQRREVQVALEKTTEARFWITMVGLPFKAPRPFGGTEPVQEHGNAATGLGEGPCRLIELQVSVAVTKAHRKVELILARRKMVADRTIDRTERRIRHPRGASGHVGAHRHRRRNRRWRTGHPLGNADTDIRDRFDRTVAPPHRSKDAAGA